MNIIGIDLETTGLEATSSEILQVGWAVIDCNSATFLKQYEEVVSIKEELPENIKNLTNIRKVGSVGLPYVLQNLKEDILKYDCRFIVAHNHFFEKSFLQHNDFIPTIPWVDTMHDIPLPEHLKTVLSLEILSLRHGIPNPAPHTALNDVYVMLRLLFKYPPVGVICQQAINNGDFVTVAAHVKYDDRELAKASGFFWDSLSKKWKKQVRKNLAGKFPFNVSICNE